MVGEVGGEVAESGDTVAIAILWGNPMGPESSYIVRLSGIGGTKSASDWHPTADACDGDRG